AHHVHGERQAARGLPRRRRTSGRRADRGRPMKITREVRLLCMHVTASALVSKWQQDACADLPYSITSSARASSAGGMVMPSAFDIFRLITISNFLGNYTGRSAGFSPFKMR